MCKTPALGGRVIECKACGHKHYIYYSCGHSQCMLCQSIKREQWMDKLKSTLLRVPYMHMVFTLPHQLNGLARQNEKIIYGLILKVAWQTVDSYGKQQGYNAGMTSVLHTFGSDMKYHIHVHGLVTFGGLDKENNWIYPLKKYGFDSYRGVCSAYKNIFIAELKKLFEDNKLTYHQSSEDLIKEAETLRWVVHTTRPSMNTAVIENYLARYINRIAVTKKRLQYIKEHEQVQLLYNDYKNQQKGKPAPKGLLHLHPLVAIDTIMQHVLPPRFQKSRNYGLHKKSSKLNKSIPDAIKRSPVTIRKIMEIITTLMQNKQNQCVKCKSIEYTITEIAPDKDYIYKFIRLDSLKSPPTRSTHIISPSEGSPSHATAIANTQKNSTILS